MADVVIVPANVLLQEGATDPLIVKGVYRASVVIDAGQMVYIDDVDANSVSLVNTAVLASSKVLGMAHGSSAAGQDIVIVSSGRLKLGTGNVVQGTPYFCSPNNGEIAPEADVLSTEFVSIVGVASSADDIDLIIVPSEIEKS